MSDEAEDYDLLAGIYVLGALELDEARAVEALADRDAHVAHAIETWQNRLAPLARLARPRAPPSWLWERIALSVGFERDWDQVETFLEPPLWRQLRDSLVVWRAAAAASIALVVAVLLIGVFTPAEAPRYAAALSPQGTPGPAFMVETLPDGSILVRPVAKINVASGKDLELWARPAGARQPVALGVLPSIGRRVVPRETIGTDTDILVSLEPQGGSPTGQPTGPVLYGGTLARMN